MSALDLARSYIPRSVFQEVNLVFVDSGLYEARGHESATAEAIGLPDKPLWAMQDYEAIASSIERDGNVVLVNFDLNDGLKQQIEGARRDFSFAPHAASDFLAKPESPATLLNAARMAECVEELGKFDMIGVTAKEAGESLVERCRTLIILRDALACANMNIPIHVFGAISPMEVLTYFFCGADVFDGLNWLRLGFRDHGSIPIESTAFEDGKARAHELDLLMEEWTANLSLLYRFQESLHWYTVSHDFLGLTELFPAAPRAARIAELAGAALVGE